MPHMNTDLPKSTWLMYMGPDFESRDRALDGERKMRQSANKLDGLQLIRPICGIQSLYGPDLLGRIGTSTWVAKLTLTVNFVEKK